MDSKPFRSLADVEALERTPYAQAMPAQTTYGLIAYAARRFGERDAFRYLNNGDIDTPARCVSYAGLVSHIHRAANLFRAMGVGPDDAVAILAPNMPETQFALWGAQLAGIACPINYLLQPDHIAALLVASKAKVIVALGPNHELNLWPTVEKVLALTPLPVLQITAGDDAAPGVAVFQDLLAQHSEALNFDPQLTPERIAACYHTGGTTGAPKLALHTHGNEAHTSWFAHRFYGFDEHTIEINGFPLFHVAGAFVYGLSMLAIGATQVLPTLSGMRNAAFGKNYWKFCERERVTALACVPTVLATLVNLPVDADISSVRVAYTGGSPLPSELAVQFEARLGIPVRNIFGMTECAGLVSIEPAAAPRVSGSTGLRLPYTEVHAVPWRDGAAQLDLRCAAGETGVIVLRGPHISPGYTDVARDEGMFQTDAGRTRWLVSGDLGHVDAQGYIHITGRAKDVIIRGSHNIDPGLVEDAFLAHPAVAMCAVVGEPDAYAGELPVAFVTLKPGMQCDAAALMAQVAPHVYERPAAPKRVTIIDAMPVTAIGKIYKPTLRLRAMETKLTEMLSDVPQATIKGIEQGGTLTAQVWIASKNDTLLERQLRARLAAIAVKVEIVFTGT
jgi:fatty-acyl-CoA synthase